MSEYAGMPEKTRIYEIRAMNEQLFPLPPDLGNIDPVAYLKRLWIRDEA